MTSHLTTKLPGGQLAVGAFAIGLVGLAVFAPMLVPLFRLTQLTVVAAIALALCGQNLIGGYLGQIFLAQSAFFGLGAYVAANLVTKHGWSVLETLPVIALLSFAVGVVLELPAVRLDGLYLALITLAIAVAFPSFVRRFDSLTNGASGIFGLAWLAPSWTGQSGYIGAQRWHYWVALALLLIGLGATASLRHSRVGRGWIAIRDNEISARSTGVHVTRVKAITCGLAAAIGGVAGAVYAFSTGTLTPDQFGLQLAIMFTISMIVAGSGTVIGPVVGGLVYVFVPYYTTNIGNGPISGVLFGFGLVVLIFVMPNGVIGRLSDLRSHIRWRAITAKAARTGASPATPHHQSVLVSEKELP